MSYSFFRCYSEICFSVFLAGGLGWWTWSPSLLSQFAQEKMFMLLESRKLHSNSQSISKANLVTFRDFLGLVKIYHSVDAIVFKVITVFPLKALGIHIVKWRWTEVAFVRFCVVRSYGDFKVHHLVFCMQKMPKYFCRKAGILLDYRKIH